MTPSDCQTLTRNREQIIDALGPLNRWYAGEELGHEPTDSEAITHYITHGGAKRYAETHQEN